MRASSTLERAARASFFTIAFTGLAAAAACSSGVKQDEPNPVPIPTAQPTGDAGPDVAPNPECSGPEGCFKCEVTNLSQALDQCSDSQCAPFDNVARLPLFNGGSLPPVP